MKTIKSLITLTLMLCAATAAQAQQQEEKTVKPMPAATAKPPAADKPSAEPVAKPIAQDVVPVSAKPSSEKVKPEDMKGMELNPGMQKVMPAQNADRPKTSTLGTPKQPETVQPAAKPKPLVAIPADN